MEWNITQVLKIILEQNYLPIVKGIGNVFPCSTNLKKLFHIFIILGKKILTVVTLLNNMVKNSSFPFSNLPAGKMNLIGEKARKRNLFIINWLISNICGSKFFFFFASKFMFYDLISIKFFKGKARKIRCYLIFSLKFCFIWNLKTSLLSKNFKKKVYLARTWLARKHLSKYPKIDLSSSMPSFISSNSV